MTTLEMPTEQLSVIDPHAPIPDAGPTDQFPVTETARFVIAPDQASSSPLPTDSPWARPVEYNPPKQPLAPPVYKGNPNVMPNYTYPATHPAKQQPAAPAYRHPGVYSAPAAGSVVYPPGRINRQAPARAPEPPQPAPVYAPPAPEVQPAARPLDRIREARRRPGIFARTMVVGALALSAVYGVIDKGLNSPDQQTATETSVSSQQYQSAEQQEAKLASSAKGEVIPIGYQVDLDQSELQDLLSHSPAAFKEAHPHEARLLTSIGQTALSSESSEQGGGYGNKMPRFKAYTHIRGNAGELPADAAAINASVVNLAAAERADATIVGTDGKKFTRPYPARVVSGAEFIDGLTPQRPQAGGQEASVTIGAATIQVGGPRDVETGIWNPQ